MIYHSQHQHMQRQIELPIPQKIHSYKYIIINYVSLRMLPKDGDLKASIETINVVYVNIGRFVKILN